MADKINTNNYISKESDLVQILSKFYESKGKPVNNQTFTELTAQDAEAVKGTPEAQNYTWVMSNVAFAYLYNYEEIKTALPKVKVGSKEIESKPLATDEVMGLINDRKAKAQAKAQERKEKDEQARREAMAQGREYVKPSSNAFVSPITLSPKGDAIKAQLLDRTEEMVEMADKSAILKVIRIHRPLPDRMVHKNNPMIKMSFGEKNEKAKKILDDEPDLVEGDENRANYEKIKEYMLADSDAELAANTKVSKGPWKGVKIRIYDGKELTLTRSEFLDYISKVGMAINLHDASRPGATIRFVTKKSKKNDAPATKDIQVVLTNTKTLADPSKGYEVYATDVDTSKTKSVLTGSAISYKVRVMEKDAAGNKTSVPKIHPTTKQPVTRTKRAPGYIEVYDEKPIPMYWLPGFEKSSEPTTKSKTSVNNAIQAGIDALAQNLAEYDDAKKSHDYQKSQVSASKMVSELFSSRWANLNFDPNGSGTVGMSEDSLDGAPVGGDGKPVSADDLGNLV